MHERTSNYYQNLVNEVLLFIDQHIDQPLDVKNLAKRFCISHYHFHRILAAALGEPVGNYINKKRFEIAIHLLRFADLPISDIALKIGYNDVSAFSKMFTKQFGISPQTYRNQPQLVINTKTDFWLNNNRIEHSEIRPKFIEIPDIVVYFIQNIGKYGGLEIYKAWEELERFVIEYNPAGWHPDYFSVYYDDPDDVGEDQCLSDVCVVLKKQVRVRENIGIKTIEGGTYAVFRYKGPFENLWQLYNYVYSTWLLNSNLKLADKPIREKYVNYSAKTPPHKLITEIYVPIEKA